MQNIKEILQKDVKDCTWTEIGAAGVTGTIVAYGIFCTLRYFFM